MSTFFVLAKVQQSYSTDQLLASTYAALRGIVRVGTTVGGGEAPSSSSSSSSDCDVRRRLLKGNMSTLNRSR